MNLSNILIIDAEILRGMFANGLEYLRRDETLINDLNVFPVPDGDTGTNMRITLENGLEKAKNSNNVSSFFFDLSEGALFGARGNSGVLLSQYIKGISIALDGKEKLNVTDFALSLRKGYEKAYSASIEPAEGTILTVAREGIENTIPEINEKTTFVEFLHILVNKMSFSLENTPSLLPVLKEHGVIDSGAKGLLTIFEGMLAFLEGKKLENNSTERKTIKENDYSSFNSDSELDYGYCTEFILQLLNAKIKNNPFDLENFISFLKENGNSIVAFQEGDRVKVHIHTITPAIVISKAQTYGEFISFKMENMALQHNETIKNKQNKKEAMKEFAIVSIANGSSLIEMFKSLGSDYVIDGGHTMSASVNEILDTCALANAKTVFLLPNNPNLLLTAKQASSLSKDFKIEVIESKSLQEGYMALQSTLKTLDIDAVRESLKSAIENVSSYFVAISSKNSVECEEITYSIGDYVGGEGHKIDVAGTNLVETTLELMKKVPDIDEKEVMFLLYGTNVSEKDLNELKGKVEEEYPYLEIGFVKGDFSIYSYLLGIVK